MKKFESENKMPIDCSKKRTGTSTKYKDVLKRKYNMTGEDYKRLAKKQENRCAICNRWETGRYRHLSIDHNHKTGQIRGLLCTKCNTVLGMAGDNIEILQNAIKYLNKVYKGQCTGHL